MKDQWKQILSTCSNKQIGDVSSCIARWFKHARLHAEVIGMEKIREKESTTLLISSAELHCHNGKLIT